MLAWRPDLRRPYESAWGLAQRFSALNAPTLRDFYQQFGDTKARGYASYAKGADCSDPKYFNLTAVQALLGFTKADCDRLFTREYPLSLFWHEDKELKFCPECISLGYHSAVHQAVTLVKCPIHEAPLISQCPSCNSRTAYAIGQNIETGSFNCPACHPVVAPPDVEALIAPLPERWVTAIQEFVDNATKVAEDPRGEHWVFDKAFHSDVPRWAYGLLARELGLPDGFTRLFEQPAEHLLNRSYAVHGAEKPPAVKAKIKAGLSPTGDAVARIDFYERMCERHDRALDRVYRQVKRRLYSHLRGAHEPCLRAMSVVPKFTNIRFAPTSCTLALAFERWVYYWESLQLPDSDARMSHGGISYYSGRLQSLEAGWDEYGVEGAALKVAISHMFHLTLYGTFLGALLLSEEERAENLNPIDRHWPGIGHWCFPRVFVVAAPTFDKGIRVLSDPATITFKTIKERVATIPSHPRGHAKVLRDLKTWYYLDTK